MAAILSKVRPYTVLLSGASGIGRFIPPPQPFNAVGVDYFTLGNHDFNFGYDVLREYLNAMDGVCLCANVESLDGGLPLQKDAVHTLANGLRVGVTGVVTDFVNVWEQPQNLERVRVTDAFQAADSSGPSEGDSAGMCASITAASRRNWRADGFCRTAGENIACKIARELDFDLLLTGHQHMAVEQTVIAGTFAVQPPANASRYARITGHFDEPTVHFSSRLLPSGEQAFRASLPIAAPVGGICATLVGSAYQDAYTAYRS